MFDRGDIVGGKYRIEDPIARGGMGLVVAATHIKLGIKVALKFLREDYIKDDRIVERFVNEAQAAAQLRSVHVCRVSDVETADGVPYIVMELLYGRDLQTVVKTAPLDVPTATNYVLQACHAIAEAHAIGIVHRDLKPANLYLTYGARGKPLIKVLDFGIAKAQPKSADGGMTQTQTVMGSPGYMSPEQLRSTKTVDARTDIWSLGVVLYELVVGERPWLAESVSEITLMVANDPMPVMPAMIPRAFVDVVARCLNKEPEHRFPDVGALAAALAPFAPDGAELAIGVQHELGAMAIGPVGVAPALSTRSEQATASLKAPTAESAPTTMTTASGVIETSRRPRIPRKPVVLGVGVLVVAIVAIVAVGSGQGDHATAPSTAPSPALRVDVAPDAATPDAIHDAPIAPTTSSGRPPATKPVKPVGKKQRPKLEDVRDSRF